jgi:hypothetical protein
LNNIMRNTLLVNTVLIWMMFYLNKHIYDIMIILIKSFLWIKLNMNLPKFLTETVRGISELAVYYHRLHTVKSRRVIGRNIFFAT